MTQSLLDTNVLVLNRFYMAIRVVNVRRALTLLYRQCAEVIDLDAGQYVSYDFESWCELGQLTSIDKQPGEEYIQAVGFELASSPHRSLDSIRQDADANGPIQSQKFVCA